ncbi:MAG TPA: hypothetical protein VFN48_07370 [Solirubrobacteraceae bacterium]|nr:hypothetical protein [Solirubrobacteraceae bacterium]
MSAPAPGRSRRVRFLVTSLSALVVLIACAACGSSRGALSAALPSASSTPSSEPVSPTTTAPIRSTPAGVRATIRAGVEAPVAPTSRQAGFIGVASEISTIPTLAGGAADPDHAFVNLLRNLSPGAPFLLRLGGDSTDWSWWPIPGMATPRPIRYAITPAWAAGVKTLLHALGGRALLGVNLELDNARVAADEVRQYEHFLGSSLIGGFELGNEPELYPAFDYYKLPDGRGVKGRPRSYDMAAYGRDFSTIARSLPNAPLVGPEIGAPKILTQLNSILSGLPSRLQLVTVHAYPMKRCSASTHLPISQFFAPASIQGLAAQVGAMVRAARAHHKPLRVDEINGISCGGQAGVSNTFAEALWALNILPALWQAGVQGVNIQTIDGNLNQVFTATHSAAGWRVSTQPEYLGLLAFAQAAPGGSHLVKVAAPNRAGVYAFATRTPSGQEHVIITNTTGSTLSEGVSVAGGHGAAAVSLLQARSLAATGGATLAGESLSTSTGELTGTAQVAQVGANRAGVYGIRVPPHSAAILTVAR